MPHKPKPPFFEVQNSERQKRIKQRICVAYACKNKTKGRCLCGKHTRQRIKFISPLKYFYQVLKQNARRRQKEFSLTLNDFKEFCEKTDYLIKKGRYTAKLQIDRRDNNRGYTRDNIQALTQKENVAKYNQVDRYNNCPF